MDIWLAIWLAAAAAAGAAAAALVASARLRAAAAQTMLLRDQLGKSDDELRAARYEANQWRTQAEKDATARAVAETKLNEQDLIHREKIAALTAIRDDIDQRLQTITGESLRNTQSAFLEIANEVLDKHKAGASAELTALVSPIRETLQAYQAALGELDKQREQGNGALFNELKTVVEVGNAVRIETSRLVNALRAAPKTRGRWGERALRNALELAGLNAYSDFVVEQSYAREGALLRPDVVIRLPGGRSLVVDAKVSISAYIDAVESAEEEARERHLNLHARQLRDQVKLLAAKSYWDGLTETPDFVVMFVPGENFYAAAVERDPELFEFALRQRVLIVTPATLIGLVKTVAYGWRQEKAAENAKRVHELGRELYKRLATMGGHIVAVGKHLSGTVQEYNRFVGSLENSVMPQARRFHELEVVAAGAELAALAPIELHPRPLRPDRDLSLPVLALDSQREAAG